MGSSSDISAGYPIAMCNLLPDLIFQSYLEVLKRVVQKVAEIEIKKAFCGIIFGRIFLQLVLIKITEIIDGGARYWKFAYGR